MKHSSETKINLYWCTRPVPFPCYICTSILYTFGKFKVNLSVLMYQDISRLQRHRCSHMVLSFFWLHWAASLSRSAAAALGRVAAESWNLHWCVLNIQPQAAVLSARMHSFCRSVVRSSTFPCSLRWTSFRLVAPVWCRRRLLSTTNLRQGKSGRRDGREEEIVGID